jgi:hypothetical protein
LVHILYNFLRQANFARQSKGDACGRGFTRCYIYLFAYKKQLVATTGHLTYSIKYELYEPLKINKETFQVQNMTESTVSQETNETTIMFCGYNCQSTYQIQL